jgi:hypothetical protein
MKHYLLLALSALAVGCKQNADDKDIPPALHFALLDKQGNNLLTSTSTPLQVSTIDANGKTIMLGSECAGGGCTMIRSAAAGGATAPKYAFVYSSLGAALASQSGSKTWYLELNGKTDTLYFDVQHTRYETVRFNGQPAIIDPAQLPVYVFQRRH